MHNPFTIRGTIQNPNDFIGRTEELEHLLARIRTKQSCSIIGERRIGKSSLLYYLYQTGQKRLQDSCFRFIYIELTAAHASTQVDFLKTVLKALGLIYPIKSGHIKKRVVGKNLPQMLPDFGSDWQSANEAGCNRFRYIQTPFGVWLRG